jgi:4-amino-4-deoxy-L-arabinose transferase-like glycosyltransferase
MTTVQWNSTSPLSMSKPIPSDGNASAFATVIQIVAAAFLLRLGFVLLVFRDVASAGVAHQQFGWEMGWVARSIALAHGFSSPFAPSTGATALVPPLYPYLLALVFRIYGLYSPHAALAILSLNSTCSALTCVPVYLLAREVGGSRVGKIAGWLWVVYPFSVYFSSTRVWDYSVTSLLLATCWWLTQRAGRRGSVKQAAVIGILFGVAALSNPSVLSMFPIALGFTLWRMHRLGNRWLRFGLVVVLLTSAVLAPWTIRNAKVLHAAVPVRDGFWLEFWAGNHGDSSTSNPSSAHPASNEAEMTRYQQLGEVAYVSQKRALGLAYVRQHPVAFLVVSTRRVLRFWTGFWSASASYLRDEPLDVPNVFFCSAVTFLMLRGVLRSWRNSPEATVTTILMLLVFPLPYYLTHSSMDYRQPIEPEIVMMVALGLPRRFSLASRNRRGLLHLASFAKAKAHSENPPVVVHVPYAMARDIRDAGIRVVLFSNVLKFSGGHLRAMLSDF